MDASLDYKESWMLKKWCFWTAVLEKTLESLLDCKNKPDFNPEYSLEGLMLKHQYFGPLMGRANPLEKTLMLGKIKGRRRRGWQRMRWLGSSTDSIDMNLSKLRKIVKDRGAWCAAVQGVTKSLIKLSDWTINKKQFNRDEWLVSVFLTVMDGQTDFEWL